MSNSPLATETYYAHSSNYSRGRSKKIEKITIHHMAGVLTAKQCGGIFQNPSRNASSNYGIGKNGEIAVFVDEANTSWCDSNWDSNCKSVTIETSNSQNGGNWPVSDTVLNSLIRLVADIAKRNNLGTLVKGQNVTWHCMYANTDCPGPYLLSKMDYIIEEANKLNAPAPEPAPEPAPYNADLRGKHVIINGDLYVSSDATKATGYAREKHTIVTRYVPGALHPYNTTGDLGWMDASSIRIDTSAEPEKQAIVHTVRAGENLSTIAKKYGTTWQKIYEDNKHIIGSNPNLIRAGQTLTIN